MSILVITYSSNLARCPSLQVYGKPCHNAISSPFLLSIHVLDALQTRLAWACSGGEDIRVKVRFIVCNLG